MWGCSNFSWFIFILKLELFFKHFLQVLLTSNKVLFSLKSKLIWVFLFCLLVDTLDWMFSEDFHFIWEILGLPILNSIPQLPSVKTLFVSSWKDDPTKCTRINIRRNTESKIFLTSQSRRLRLLWFSMPSLLEGLLWRRNMIFMMNAVLESWVQQLRLSHLD